MQHEPDKVRCRDIKPTRPIPSLNEDVRRGLLERPRTLQPKYFYDARGSDLFARICDTPEYYPTRTEEALLNRYSQEIIDITRPRQIIELGSGDARKTRNLFQACESLNCASIYVPLDVCQEMLLQSSSEIIEDFPWLQIQPLLGDFHAGLGNLPRPQGCSLYVFLGGSIGNFTPREAQDFLRDLFLTLNHGDYFLLGADRKKDSSVLHAAYNDAAGITAEFNLNILNVLNNELDADFDIEKFEHAAYFNDDLNRIEMHLISKTRQVVEIDELDETLELDEGETILTEISCKYTQQQLENMLLNTGFSIEQHYQPENQYFSLLLARKNEQ